jgi:hypothetical protein
VLLFVFTGLRVLVAEDEVYLGVSVSQVSNAKHTAYLVGGTALIRTEHDDVRRGVRELLGVERLVVLEELHVCTTTLEAVCDRVSIRSRSCRMRSSLTLELDLVLNNEGVALVINGLGELGRDGVVGSCILDDQALVAFHTLQHRRLLDRPGANVGPFLIVSLDILLGVRGLPPALPVVCELLKEWRLKLGGLHVLVSSEHYYPCVDHIL